MPLVASGNEYMCCSLCTSTVIKSHVRLCSIYQHSMYVYRYEQFRKGNPEATGFSNSKPLNGGKIIILYKN